MVAFFRYSPVDILSVRLPPSVLEFDGHSQQDWMRKEELEVLLLPESGVLLLVLDVTQNSLN